MNQNIKVGDIVKWWESTYFVVEVTGDGALLKQNFSIETTLISPVPLKDLTLIK